MSNRREKVKAKTSQLNKQPQEPVVMTLKGSQNETILVNGKYLLDLSKLVFAGIVLTGVQKNRGLVEDQFLWGLVFTILLYFLGIILVSYSNFKKSRI